MGQMAAIAQGAGAVANMAGGINSGIKGARAQRQLNEAQAGQDTLYQGMMTNGMGILDNMMGLAGQYQNPALANAILAQGQGAAGGVAGAHNATADALANQGYADQAAGLFGGGYQNNVSMPQLASIPGFVNNVGIPQAGGLMSFTAPGLNHMDFTAPGQMANQMVDQALAMGDRARVGARESLANQTTAMQQGLSAALADRGMSNNSGVAGAALQNNAMQGMTQLAGLERSIADMAGNAAIQGAQIDANNLMQLTGMRSNYNLGMNQLGQQSALNQFQANLGAQQQHFGQQMAGAQLQNLIDQGQNQFNLNANQQTYAQQLGNAQLQAGIDQNVAGWNQAAAQGLMGLQGLANQTTLAQGDLRSRAYTDPLSIMQGIYQSNYLNPSMQMNQMLGGMAGGLMTGALGGMEAGLDRRAKGVAAAGEGKSAGMSAGLGGLETMGNTLSGKKTGNIGAKAPLPSGGFVGPKAPLTTNPYAQWAGLAGGGGLNPGLFAPAVPTTGPAGTYMANNYMGNYVAPYTYSPFGAGTPWFTR